MENKIILVDNADNEIGYGDKIDVHIKAQLHRAFSVFIFDSTSHRMLIQRRDISLAVVQSFLPYAFSAPVVLSLLSHAYVPI